MKMYEIIYWLRINWGSVLFSLLLIALSAAVAYILTNPQQLAQVLTGVR
jgi:hypothetical protein